MTLITEESKSRFEAGITASEEEQPTIETPAKKIKGKRSSSAKSVQTRTSKKSTEKVTLHYPELGLYKSLYFLLNPLDLPENVLAGKTKFFVLGLTSV